MAFLCIHPFLPHRPHRIQNRMYSVGSTEVTVFRAARMVKIKELKIRMGWGARMSEKPT